MHVAALPLSAIDGTFLSGPGYTTCEVVVNIEVLDTCIVFVVLECQGYGSDGNGFAF